MRTFVIAVVSKPKQLASTHPFLFFFVGPLVFVLLKEVFLESPSTSSNMDRATALSGRAGGCGKYVEDKIS